MPPKKKGNAQQKKVQKTVEDKTFGMKNKNKSKKVQNYVKQVEQQAQNQGKKKRDFNQPMKTKKELQAEKQAERGELFKPMMEKQAKPEAGVDPKTILCQFFVQGTCKRGYKCRYSHDKTIVRKVTKRDIYADTRKEDDTMDKWSQEQLEEAVLKKQGKNASNSTNIVCKYFLEAIESAKYGWFWECPNGGENCKYRHALPPGFVLRAPGEAKNPQDEEDGPTLEEELDEERRLLKEKLAETGGGTPVTLERFLEWRERRKAMKIEERKKEEAAKARGLSKAERDHRKLMSGREMFVFKPDLFVDDDAAGDDIDYRIEDSDDEEVHELEATGTSLTRTVVKGGKGEDAEEEQDAEESKKEEPEEEEDKKDEKKEEPEEEKKEEPEEKKEEKEEKKSDVPINEDLFADDAGDLSDGDLE